MLRLAVLFLASTAVAVKEYDQLIFEEDFSEGLDFSIWEHEIVRSDVFFMYFLLRETLLAFLFV